MVSKRQEAFLKTLDTENLLNGYRGDEHAEATATQKSIFADAIHILNHSNKKDARTWFLRVLKSSHLQSVVKSGGALSKKEEKFFRVRETSQGTPFDSVEPERVISTFNHYVRDLDIPSINNFQYEQQAFYDLVDVFTNLEVDHLELKDREVVPDWSVETVLADYGEFLFVDLGVSGSRTEGDSMGHCGNGTGKRTQRVFSLRQKLPNGNLIPRATLIGNNCNFGNNGLVESCDLGEIKGYANEKVSKKYRSYIANAILDLGIFKSKINGDYLPEVDLSLLDFERDTALHIATKIPTYANPFEASVLTNYEGGEILDNAIKEHFSLEPSAMLKMGGDNIMPHLDRLIDPKLGGRAKLAEFMAFQENPNKHVFNTLPSDIQTDLMMFAVTEGMDMSKMDVAEHISSSSALSVFYKGVVKTYLDEQANPQVDTLMSDIAKELNAVIEVSDVGGVSLQKSFSSVVMDFTKDLAKSDPSGNPMNSSEAYRHLERGTFNDGKLRVLNYAESQFINEARRNEHISKLLLDAKIRPFANEHSLAMLKTTATAMNSMLQYQIKEQGLSPSQQITNSGDVVAGDGKIEIVKLPYKDVVSQSVKLGVDTESIRKSVLSNLRWMGDKNPAIDDLAFVMIREKGDGVDSKNVAIGAVLDDCHECKLIHVSFGHGVKALKTGLSDSIISLVTESENISLSDLTSTWRREDGMNLANMEISKEAEYDLLKTVGYDNGETSPIFLFGADKNLITDLMDLPDAPHVLKSHSVNIPVTSTVPSVEILDVENHIKRVNFIGGEADPVDSDDHKRIESNFQFLKGRLRESLTSGAAAFRLQGLLNRSLEENDLASHRLMGERPMVNGQILTEYVKDVLDNISYSDFDSLIKEAGVQHLEKQCGRMGLDIVEVDGSDFRWLLKEDYSFFENAKVYKELPANSLTGQLKNLVDYHVSSNTKHLDFDDLNGMIMTHLTSRLAIDVVSETNAHDGFSNKLLTSIKPKANDERAVEREKVQRRLSDIPF